MSRASHGKRPVTVALVALALVALGATAAAAAVANHLIVSEVVVQVRTSPAITGAKYVELVNPTASAVDLAHVYLTDATFNAPPTYYYDIVKLGRAGGGGTGGDFHARFPDGATIAAGDTIAVAITGSADYLAAYGRLPDYELYEDALAPDAVPDLTPAFPGSIGRGLADPGSNVPDLSTAGESLMLYAWDGQSDRVEDLDYVLWGSSSLTSVRIDKTGVSVDGPDADATPTAYLPDSDILTQHSLNNSSTPHNFGNSFQRLSADEGAEVPTGGNGQTGHDETSEPLNSTWRTTAAQTPPVAPASFTPPAPVVTAATLTPAAPVAGQTATVNATVLANDGVAGVSVFWTDDAGANWHEVVGAGAGGNSWTAAIPEHPAGTTVSWYVRAASTGGAHATRPTGAPVYFETYQVEAPPVYPPLLLLTQVCVQPSAGEFVEICNPTDAAVDLSDYYLTDALHSPANEFYWRVVEPSPSATTIGGGAFTDFHARFPAGAHIAAGDTITVSIGGSTGFMGTYGFAPDFELYEDDAEADDVPDMREVFPGSNWAVDSLSSLSNAGETVILYYWNGQTDLVTDIDVFFWGTTTTYRFDKTGVSIDGPDANTTPTAYRPDTPVGGQQPFPSSHAMGESFHRLDATEGTEIKTGGNGTLGHDETSENLPVTWGIAAAAPSPPGGGVQAGGGGLALDVPPRTFLPLEGESFPIRFRSERGTQTELRIFDLAGRLVVTLFDSRYDGGFATAEGQWTRRNWTGRDGQFELLPAGLYVVHLSAVNQRTGKEHNKTAPVVLATRLSK